VAPPASQLDLSPPTAINPEPEIYVGIQEGKTMNSLLEQVAAGAPLILVIILFVGGSIAFVCLCDWIKDLFSDTPRLLKKQRSRISVWQLWQIMKGRATYRTASLSVPTERERNWRKLKSPEPPVVQAAPIPEPKAEHPEILFENGKAVIRPHTRVPAPVSTMRLTFQDGEELDISSDIELAGLSEEDFRTAYAAFTKTQADLRGIQNPPPLNSKFWKDFR
jgi:hypothetical protein